MQRDSLATEKSPLAVSALAPCDTGDWPSAGSWQIAIRNGLGETHFAQWLDPVVRPLGRAGRTPGRKSGPSLTTSEHSPMLRHLPIANR